MAAKLPSMLVDINAFFNDKSFAGLCNTVSLPKVVTKTVDQVLSGVAGDIERDIGKLEKLECEVTISDYSSEIIDLLGSRDSRDKVFIVRGYVDTDKGGIGVAVKMQGFWKSMEHGGEFKPEEEASLKFAIAVDVYTFEVEGKEILHIDKMLNIYRVNGKDRNEEWRKALAQ